MTIENISFIVSDILNGVGRLVAARLPKELIENLKEVKACWFEGRPEGILVYE